MINDLKIFREVFNKTGDAIFIADAETARIIDVNERICTSTGYCREELLNMRVMDVDAVAIVLSQWKESVKVVREKGTIVIKGSHKRKDGTTFPVETNISYYPLDEHHGYLIGIARDTTTRTQSDNKLTANTHFLQTLIDATPTPIFYKDIHGLYTGCNAAFEAYIGMRKSDIIGKSVYDIAPRKLADKYDEMDKEILRTDGVQVYEASVRYADGALHDVIFNKARFTNADGSPAGLIGVILDITERKNAEKALLESERMLKTIIDTDPECIKLLDENSNLIMMNRSGLDMIQVDSLDQVKGQCFISLITPEHRTAFRDLTKRVFQGESGTIEFEIVGIKGKHLLLETLAVPLRNINNEVISLLGITRDVGEQRRIEGERDKLISDLQKALAEIKTLRGILPICSYCKKICDDKGAWTQMEAYISKHSDALFSHAMCPACSEKAFKEMEEWKKENEIR